MHTNWHPRKHGRSLAGVVTAQRRPVDVLRPNSTDRNFVDDPVNVFETLTEVNSSAFTAV